MNRVLLALIGLVAVICMSLLNLGCSRSSDFAVAPTPTRGLTPISAFISPAQLEAPTEASCDRVTTPNCPPLAEAPPRAECGNMTPEGCEIFQLTNVERRNAGLSPFALCEACTAMASEQSTHMVNNNYFDHDRPNGERFGQRAARFGLSAGAGENLARGGDSAAAFVRMWMNSPGHRANILNPEFKRLGVAHDRGDATQVFSR